MNLLLVLSPVALAYICYILFLAIMALYKAKLENSLTTTQKILGYPILYFGLFIDFLTNVTVCWALFWSMPREWLVTSRLIRHKREGGRRGKIAEFICRQLDNIDPTGCHCKD